MWTSLQLVPLLAVLSPCVSQDRPGLVIAGGVSKIFLSAQTSSPLLAGVEVFTLHYVTLHYITLHFITLIYITLYFITLRYITLDCITLR